MMLLCSIGGICILAILTPAMVPVSGQEREISPKMEIKEVKIGDSGVFACEVGAKELWWKPSITWSINDVPVDKTKPTIGDDTIPYTEAVSPHLLALRFDKFAENHSSILTCSATLKEKTLTKYVDLRIAKLKILSNNTQYGSVGENSIVECRTSIASRKTWSFSNGTEIRPSNKFGMGANELIIKNTTYDDVRLYKCTAGAVYTHRKDEIVILFHIADTNTTGQLKTFSVHSLYRAQTARRQAGKAGVFGCQARTSTPGRIPQLFWRMGGVWVTRERNNNDDTIPYVVQASKNTIILEIDNLQEKHSSTLTCVGTLQGITESDSLTLEVFKKLEIVSKRKQFGIEGEDGRVECKTSTTSQDLRWYKNGTRIQPSRKYIMGHDTLTIKNLDFDDTMDYKCSAYDPGFTKKTTAFIKFDVVRKLLNLADDVQYGGLGDTGVLACKPSIGTATTSWSFANGTEIQPSDKYKRSGHKLHIKNLTLDDKETYRCSALGANQRHDLLIRFYVVQVKILSPGVQRGCLGEEGRLKCDPSIPSVTIKWFKDGEKIKPSDKYVIDENSLIIKNLTRDDMNGYACQAQTVPNHHTAWLWIQLPVLLKIWMTSDILSVSPGGSRMFVCEINTEVCGYLHKLSWSINGSKIFNEKPTIGDKTIPYVEAVSSNLHILKIDELAEKHSSILKCTGTLNGHEYQDSVELRVDRLKIISDPTQFGYLGEEGRLHCIPSIKHSKHHLWYFMNGTRIRSSRKYDTETWENMLIIKKLTREDGMVYRCLVFKNGSEEYDDKLDITLNVLDVTALAAK